MTRFFALEISPNHGHEFAMPFGESEYGPRCETCGRPISGPITPLAIRFEGDVRIADFVWSVPELCAVDAVRRAFERTGLVGIEYQDVRVRVVDTSEQLRAKLWHLATHRGARVASCMWTIPRRRCLGCGKVDYSTWDGGVVVDETTWDGSDLFRLHENVAGYLVTDKFRQVVESEGFTGVAFVPAEEYRDRWPEQKPRPVKAILDAVAQGKLSVDEAAIQLGHQKADGWVYRVPEERDGMPDES